MVRAVVLSDRMFGGVSAYSKTTLEICTRLAALGHHIAHIPMGYANRMGKQVYKKVLVYDSGNDPFGEDVAVKDYLDFKADMLIANKEPWVFKQIHRQAINFVPMAIIDHAPLSPHMLARLQSPFRVIAISRFGQRELRKNKIDSYFIPLGVRSDVYRPLDKAQCKKAFYLDPDDFVIGIVAMNRARKMIPLMLRGYKRFLELNPDVKAHLFLWTNVMPKRPPADTSQGVADVGVHLLPEMANLGISNPPNDVRWTKWEEVESIGGLPEWDPNGPWDMVRLYNAFDVHLLCSGGEGAGLTYLEAASCGVPSICTNYAAAPEYAGPTGIPVKAENYVIINTPGTRYYLADIDDMARALTKMLNTDREKLAKRARMFAQRQDWTRIMKDYWTPFLQECEEELHPLITKAGVKTWA